MVNDMLRGTQFTAEDSIWAFIVYRTEEHTKSTSALQETGFRQQKYLREEAQQATDRI
jgi:hypothetical protein